jgi:hypothetical protein
VTVGRAEPAPLPGAGADSFDEPQPIVRRTPTIHIFIDHLYQHARPEWW